MERTALPDPQLRFPIHFLEMLESLVRTAGGDVVGVRAAGGDVVGVRAACGLGHEGGEEALSLAQFERLMRHCLLHLKPHEPASLQLLRHLPVTAHGMIGVAAMTSRTLGEALDVALHYFPLVLPTHELYRVAQGKRVHVHIQRLHRFGSPYDEILSEMIPGGFHQMLAFANQATREAGSLQGSELHFSHAAGDRPERYSVYYRGVVRFGCADDRFVVPRTLLERSLFTHNRTTQAMAEAALERQFSRIAREQPVSRQVRRFLSVSLLRERVPDTTAVAEQLAISPRTLLRRLREEGTTFGTLLEAVRSERAERLLQGSDLPLVRIARQLGYSDLSSFSRAFKRARGAPPSSLRRR
ncbi:TPA: AraC family transcriptional regulator ligand-binding domain-containing protein [Pseudomonas aeruginosa]|nr:AraC family transcriptional regulator ligand-binding domain-containing protein [Pseudomonas aeruginosa]HEP8709534.1 AraC family transcriptional regulator ligand-binding domain-containing protein [Pseudomonas aeruginosa]